MSNDKYYNHDYSAETAAAEERKSRIRAKLTYAIGGITAFFGALASFLSGADWSAFFSPEGAAVAGAAVVFVRALVAFIQKPKSE